MDSLAYSQLALAYEGEECPQIMNWKGSRRLTLCAAIAGLSVLGLTNEALAILKLGDRSPAVQSVQTRLQELGYFNANATGYFGPITKASVIRFQKAHGLTADGRVGTETQAALQNSTAATASTTAIWRRGSRGDAVRLIQEQLGVAGVYHNAATGVFDENTERAVRAFQQARGLTVDGAVGPQTQAALPALGGEQPPENAIAQNPDSAATYLGEGSQGPSVRSLQQRLRSLGYYKGEITGTFDTNTKEAVMRFQQARGLTVDGVVGPRTFAMLGNAQPNRPAAAPTTTTTAPEITYLGRGSQGTRVRSLQQRLRALNYYQGDITGNFDAATEQALRRFQTAQGLTADGIAGPRTFAVLGNAKPATPSASSPAPTATPPPTAAANPSPTLPSEQVRALQQRLQERGFYDGDIDGIWGERTQAAIENARRVYNVEAEDLLKGQW